MERPPSAAPFTLPLGGGEADLALAGGKAAPLSRLAAEFPVPDGFCVTTAAHALGAEDGRVPPEVASAVRQAYADLAARCGCIDPAVAVRSSAAEEDGSEASFAGQLRTVLNVRGAEAVLRAVAECWASAAADGVRAYRRGHGLAGGGGVAVLVQRLVSADVSAVAFSVDPVRGGASGEVWINAAWGLGESVVGGTVTPDVYVVAKADLTVAQRRVAEKHRMTVAVPGGTAEVEVPAFLRREPALTAARAAEIAALAVALEGRMGRPVDIECAYAGADLYLLQCRPVTGRAR